MCGQQEVRFAHEDQMEEGKKKKKTVREVVGGEITHGHMCHDRTLDFILLVTENN